MKLRLLTFLIFALLSPTIGLGEHAKGKPPESGEEQVNQNSAQAEENEDEEPEKTEDEQVAEFVDGLEAEALGRTIDQVRNEQLNLANNGGDPATRESKEQLAAKVLAALEERQRAELAKQVDLATGEGKKAAQAKLDKFDGERLRHYATVAGLYQQGMPFEKKGGQVSQRDFAETPLGKTLTETLTKANSQASPQVQASFRKDLASFMAKPGKPDSFDQAANRATAANLLRTLGNEDAPPAPAPAAAPKPNPEIALQTTGATYTRDGKKFSEFTLEDGSKVHFTNQTTATGEKIVSVEVNGNLYRFTDEQLGLRVGEDGSISRVSQARVQPTTGSGVIQVTSGAQVSMETVGSNQYWYDPKEGQVRTASVNSNQVTTVSAEQLPATLTVSTARNRLVLSATESETTQMTVQYTAFRKEDQAPAQETTAPISTRRPVAPFTKPGSEAARLPDLAVQPMVSGTNAPQPEQQAAPTLNLTELPQETRASLEQAMKAVGPKGRIVCTEPGCSDVPRNVSADLAEGIVFLNSNGETVSPPPGTYDIPRSGETKARPSKNPYSWKELLRPSKWLP